MTRESGGSSHPIEREQLRLRQLLELSERERRLIAYDIHDGFVQDVVGAQLGIDAMLDRLAATDPESVPPLLRVRAFVRKAIDEARRVVSELRPATGDDTGLVEAIQFLVNEAETTSRLEVKFVYPDNFERLSPLLERSLVRIVQESLTNVKRHAQTKQAEVRLARTGKNIRLQIEDGGIGFELSSVPAGHYGLEGIRERARAFGGKTTIRSRPGHGTLITVIVPAEKSAAEIPSSDSGTPIGPTKANRRRKR